MGVAVAAQLLYIVPRPDTLKTGGTCFQDNMCRLQVEKPGEKAACGCRIMVWPGGECRVQAAKGRCAGKSGNGHAGNMTYTITGQWGLVANQE
eukprot:366316-Chlamydomonas_euryale.AAC.5